MIADPSGIISLNGVGNVDRGKVNSDVAINPRKIPPIMAINRSAGMAIKLFRSFLKGLIVNIGVKIRPVKKPRSPKTTV
jgi:hypothetical protein